MSATAALEAGRMDDLGRLDSAVHRLDARAKILATGAFLVAVMSFPRHEVSALMPFLLFPAGMGLVAGLPAGYLLRKVAIASPFALMVGIANPFLDHSPAALVAGHVVTGGWLSFTSILVRFTLTVWAGLVLVATTGMHPLCAGLERLGMPRLFSTQILFLYRYLFVIAEEGHRLTRAARRRRRRADQSVRSTRSWSMRTSRVRRARLRSRSRATTAPTARPIGMQTRQRKPKTCDVE